MIERLEKELNVLQIQRNILTNLNSKNIDQSNLKAFTSTTQSITTISNVLITALADILQPNHIQTIFETLVFSLNCATSQLSAVCPNKNVNGEKSKNDNLCSICCQNIHQNNIKQAKIGLEKDHRQKFRMAMEQFNRLSSEQMYSNEQDALYENQLYKQLSNKQKIFNIKTNRVEEFIHIMDSTLLALKNIEQIQIHQSQVTQKYSRISSIDTYISQFLKSSFSKKIPPWIQKLLTRFIQFERAQQMNKKKQTSTQTSPMITDEHKELAKQKRNMEKQFRRQTKQFEQLKTCYQKLQKVNKQLSKELSIITRGMQNRKQTNQSKISKRTNEERKQFESQKVSQKEIRNEKDERQHNDIGLNSFVDSIVSMTKKQRRSNQSSLLPKIRTSRVEDSYNQHKLKPFEDKEPIERPMKSKFKHKSSLEPFENNIVQQKYENELENYVANEKTSINQIPQETQEQSVMKKDGIKQDNQYELLKVSKRSQKQLSKKKITRVNTKNTFQSNISEKLHPQSSKKQQSMGRNTYQQMGFQKEEKNEGIKSSLIAEPNKLKNENILKKNCMDGIFISPKKQQNSQQIQKAQRVSEELKQYVEQHLNRRVENIIGQQKEKAKKSNKKDDKMNKRSESIGEIGQQNNVQTHQSSFMKQFESMNICGEQQTLKQVMGLERNQKMIRNSTPIPQNNKLTENKSSIKQSSVFFDMANNNKNNNKQKNIVSIKNTNMNRIKIQMKGQNIFEVLKKHRFVPQQMSYEEFQKIFNEDMNNENKQNTDDGQFLIEDATIKNIFAQLFFDSKQSIKYQQSQQKSYHKKNIPNLTQQQRNISNSMFHIINTIKPHNKKLYQTILALLRSPYQTIFNNLCFVNFISEMQQQTFQYYFRRILKIHRKCPLGPNHKCQHLEEVQKVLISLKTI